MDIPLVTENTTQTQKIAAEFAKKISLPAIFALKGNLGAGKTQFVKGLGEGLGIDKRSICSASFIVIAEYGDSPALIHIDAYRLDNPQELIDIGWDDLLERKDVIIAVEWADKVKSLLPTDRIDVEIAIVDENKRRINITSHTRNTEIAYI